MWLHLEWLDILLFVQTAKMHKTIENEVVLIYLLHIWLILWENCLIEEHIIYHHSYKVFWNFTIMTGAGKNGFANQTGTIRTTKNAPYFSVSAEQTFSELMFVGMN